MKILCISILVIVCVIALYALILYIDMRNEAKECESLHAVWHDRRRKFFGLPLSFDRYSFSTDRIFLSSGLFSTKEDEVRLYRVLDLSISRTFFQKIFNVGDIVISSSDKSQTNFVFKSVKNPKEVKEKLSELVEENRDKKRVTSREYMVADDENDVME